MKGESEVQGRRPECRATTLTPRRVQEIPKLQSRDPTISRGAVVWCATELWYGSLWVRIPAFRLQNDRVSALQVHAAREHFTLVQSLVRSGGVALDAHGNIARIAPLLLCLTPHHGSSRTARIAIISAGNHTSTVTTNKLLQCCTLITVWSTLITTAVKNVLRHRLRSGQNSVSQANIPEKIRRPTASSGTIPTCENPVIRPGIEPRLQWEEGLGNNRPWHSLNDPSQHSPGVISGNHGKPKSGWPDRETSTGGPPECKSSELPLRRSSLGLTFQRRNRQRMHGYVAMPVLHMRRDMEDSNRRPLYLWCVVAWVLLGLKDNERFSAKEKKGSVNMEHRRNDRTGERGISDKNRRSEVSSGTIPTCKNTE
ncbi:hypothetical protein PR048_021392 [Dryococelus australis]|uniref:Uncharacterized protein n=1 Tax=Dryococelus australis TaxID=614101 RepID=A0ABQ9GY56_9NEOP|nr:hypothetical protein PR048_021392 [Dryococelus australis]